MDLHDEQSKKRKFQVGVNSFPTNETKYFIDPKGFVQFPDGSKYKGPLDRGNPEGQGLIIYGDGSKYVGAWERGNAHGYGILTFQDLTRYEGHWFEGKYHG